MKTYENYNHGTVENANIALEDYIPEEKIYNEFEEYGYDAFDVNYIQSMFEITIVVSPKSYAGEFSKDFSQQMQKICDNIGADRFTFNSMLQINFHFNEDKHPYLVPSAEDFPNEFPNV